MKITSRVLLAGHAVFILSKLLNEQRRRKWTIWSRGVLDDDPIAWDHLESHPWVFAHGCYGAAVF